MKDVDGYKEAYKMWAKRSREFHSGTSRERPGSQPRWFNYGLTIREAQEASQEADQEIVKKMVADGELPNPPNKIPEPLRPLRPLREEIG